MSDIEEVIDILEVDIDKRLQDLTRTKLIEIAHTLVSNLDKKSLTDLISNEGYFPLPSIVNWLEKKEKDVLMKVLNEPETETDLRQPVEIWLRSMGLAVDVEVPLPVGGRQRAIDVCGYKTGFMSITIYAVELKSDPKRGAIDKAFSQAKDNAKGSDKSYVAFSPYVYLKYPDVIMAKLEDYEEVGLIIVDKMRVITEIAEPEISALEDSIYDSVQQYMEHR